MNISRDIKYGCTGYCAPKKSLKKLPGNFWRRKFGEVRVPQKSYCLCEYTRYRYVEQNELYDDWLTAEIASSASNYDVNNIYQWMKISNARMSVVFCSTLANCLRWQTKDPSMRLGIHQRKLTMILSTVQKSGTEHLHKQFIAEEKGNQVLSIPYRCIDIELVGIESRIDCFYGYI